MAILKRRGLLFLKLLIPSWRFFDRRAEVVSLQVRSAESDWENFSTQSTRTRWATFFNPQQNLRLAQQNLIEGFLAAHIEQKVDSFLTDRLFRIAFQLVRQKNPQVQNLQFRIIQKRDENVLFESEWIKC